MSLRSRRLSREKGEDNAGDDSPPDDEESPAEAEERSRDDETGLTQSEMFEVLRNSRRRAVLSYLNAKGGSVGLKELSRHVAATEYEIPADELSSAEYKRVYNALYQYHLLKMDELDLIEFDPETNTVAMKRSAKDLIPYVHDETNLSRLLVNLAMAATVILIAGLLLVDIGPIGQMYTGGLGILLVVSLVGFALFRTAW